MIIVVKHIHSDYYDIDREKIKVLVIKSVFYIVYCVFCLLFGGK